MAFRMIKQSEKAAGIVEMHWNAIFSSAFLMLGFAAISLLLGNAIGLKVSDAVTPGVGGALRFWSWIYVAATMIGSYGIGAFLGTRSDEIQNYRDGVIHGLTAWGLATTIAVSILNISNPAFHAIVAGTANSGAAWLAICVTGLGLFASAAGGGAGKTRIMRVQVEEEEKPEERKAA